MSESKKDSTIHTVRDSDDKFWYNGSDIVAKLGYKDAKKTIKLNVREENKKCLIDIDTNYKKYGKNIQGKSLYINENGVKHLLRHSKKLPILIKQVANHCCISINITNDIIISKEQNELDKIYKVFRDDEISLQHKVGKYFIDLYFPKYHLAIECDENDHRGRNQEDEKNREKYISEKLDCKFIRFNPDGKNYDIFELIKNIHNHIKAFENK
jgi:very-short-patch-repair endonuclease